MRSRYLRRADLEEGNEGEGLEEEAEREVARGTARGVSEGEAH